MFVLFIMEKVHAHSLKTIFMHLSKHCCPTWLMSHSQSDRCDGILPKWQLCDPSWSQRTLSSLSLMGPMESKSLRDFIVSTCACEKETVTKYVYTDLYCYKMIHTGDHFCFGWISGSLSKAEIKKTSRKENSKRNGGKWTHCWIHWTTAYYSAGVLATSPSSGKWG